MKSEYLNIYNNLIKLTRNKFIFQNLTSEDTFSDRLTIFFFFHFAFFLKVYKTNNKKSIIQKIYDFFLSKLN